MKKRDEKDMKILLACIPCILVGQQSQINLKTDKSSLELYQMTGKLVLKSRNPPNLINVPKPRAWFLFTGSRKYRGK